MIGRLMELPEARIGTSPAPTPCANLKLFIHVLYVRRLEGSGHNQDPFLPCATRGSINY